MHADDGYESHGSIFGHIANVMEGAGYVQGAGMSFATVPFIQ